MLSIEELHAAIEGRLILRGLNLQVEPGEIHAIMGPNGAGKSTLARALGGDPAYEVRSGSCRLCGEELFDLDPEERALRGLFMGFQYPPEIAGVTNRDFLFAAVNSHRKGRGEADLSLDQFDEELDQWITRLKMAPNMKERGLNEGFSGGEKKRNEILQMALLQPKVAILDETDSGLDIDALRIVADGINYLQTAERGFVLITHYQRLLNYVEPNYVHVMVDGRIVETGDAQLALELEKRGYDWLLHRRGEVG